MDESIAKNPYMWNFHCSAFEDSSSLKLVNQHKANQTRLILTCHCVTILVTNDVTLYIMPLLFHLVGICNRKQLNCPAGRGYIAD